MTLAILCLFRRCSLLPFLIKSLQISGSLTQSSKDSCKAEVFTLKGAEAKMQKYTFMFQKSRKE